MFEVLLAVTMKITIFWGVMLCNVVNLTDSRLIWRLSLEMMLH